jgi:CheY-like chemotaxis protein
MMGGRIWVESELGKGAKFSFTVDLPVGGSELEPEASFMGAESTENIFKGYTLLLAEDMEINREIVSVMLESSGIAIEYADNGIEAVDMIRNSPERYDMVFMDVQMPEMDGLEATRLIRMLPFEAARNIPIVAMSANVFREDIEKCIEAGMNNHVGKPLDFDEVFQKIKQYTVDKNG